MRDSGMCDLAKNWQRMAESYASLSAILKYSAGSVLVKMER